MSRSARRFVTKPSSEPTELPSLSLRNMGITAAMIASRALRASARFLSFMGSLCLTGILLISARLYGVYSTLYSVKSVTMISTMLACLPARPRMMFATISGALTSLPIFVARVLRKFSEHTVERTYIRASVPSISKLSTYL